MSKIDTPRADSAATTRTVRDTRTFWRTATAVIAPIPFLALAAANLIAPDDTNAETRDAVNAVLAHPGRAHTSLWLGAVFVMGLLPAVLALLWVCRRHAPRLTTAVGILSLPGAAAAPIIGSATMFVAVAVDKHVDVGTITRLADGVWNQPGLLVLVLFFLVGVVLFGRIMFGVLLWRTRVTPRWMAVGVMVAGPMDVFGPGQLLVHNGLPALSWILTAVAFSGVSLALLRTSNDDFDLRPIAAVR
jgi:Domain of unknown function (DUF4386)